MASRTQLRLGQITGSFGTSGGQINDTLGADSGGSLGAITLASGSLVSALSEMASAIKRINGGTHFAALAEGVFDLDTMSLQSSATTDPLLEIKNTTNDANGARLRFVKDKGAAGADNDVAGLIEFFADDDDQDNIKFGEIKAQVADASNGAEGGKLTLSVASHNGTLTQGILIADGDDSGEVDVTLGQGDSSITEVKGILKLGQNAIAASDGGTSITLDADDNVTIGGDLRINGNDIKASDGTTAISLSGNDVTIAGDLTVSGDTVQVDVAKLTVEDPLIELARGQGSSADAFDIGFFGKYGVGGTHKYAGLFRDQNDSGNFHLFKDTQEDLTAVTTINRGATGYAKASLVVDSLDADGGVTIDNITIDGSEIDLSSGDLTIDVNGDINFDAEGADFRFKHDGTERGLINVGANFGLCLSSSLDNDVTVDTQSGYFGINSKGLGSVANGVIAIKNAGEVFFGNWNPTGGDDAAKVDKGGNLVLKTSNYSVLSASNGLAIDAGAGNAALALSSSNGKAINIQAVNSLAASYTLTLPPNDGDSGQVLTTNGSGVLTFGSAAASTKKCIRIIETVSGLTKGGSLDTNAANPGDQINNLTDFLSTPALLDVFVNGQLMLTGSVAQVNASSRDYRVVDANNISFGFDLERDDIVQVITR